ncbi:hypothetical protein [Mycobacterium talmoniae]|uniref:Uncharacterized protein n=1 Tax=Mycobacterium talmoniae TaxID=1858794 RepID=A0A1S1NI70_9MYCO|nr:MULTISPECIES: hypothetical protein [Mycobacterium]OHV05644.1 hypothetical protein BKN37_04835 [Mycobacterium talmoniae]TDH52064.1 hypothetical protein E2F47_14840 [Mycobacterium eburneum]
MTGGLHKFVIMSLVVAFAAFGPSELLAYWWVTRPPGWAEQAQPARWVVGTLEPRTPDPVGPAWGA